MKNIQAGDVYLESLKDEVPGLAEGKASMMREACVWCLLECGHSSGVPLASSLYDESRCYRLCWNEGTIENVKLFKSYNIDDAVEFGAEAVTLLLIREQTPFTTIERAVKGTGIDYWLGFESDNPTALFSDTNARLEVSGILRESSSNTVKARIGKKLKQTKPTDDRFPVYISIIEFGKPKAEMVIKNAKH
jgi:hypothetical protein